MNRSVVLRITVPVLFVITILLGVKTFNAYRSGARHLQTSIDTLKQDNPGLRLIDSALITFNAADNNFRLYTVLYTPDYLQAFRLQLDTVTYLLGAQLSDLLRAKEGLAAKIAGIKHNTDELLAHYASDDRVEKMLSNIPSYTPGRMADDKVIIDTLGYSDGKPAKKGLLKRLGQAIANRPDTVRSTQTIVVRTKDGKVLPQHTYEAGRLQRVLADVNNYYRNVLRQQQQGRTEINLAEQSLAATNLALLDDLKKTLQTLREQALKNEMDRRFRAGLNTGTNISRMTVNFIWLFVFFLLTSIGSVFLYREYRRKTAQLAREKAKALEEARARSVFLANMSHEIRSPLNSLVGFTEQLSHTQLHEEQRELLRGITLSADMLMEVVNDVLDFSKLESDYISIQRQPFTLYQAIQDVINTMRIQAEGKQLELHFYFEGSQQQHVQGDMFRLKQILINLIGNAIKYTSTGSITVKAKLEHQSTYRGLFTFSVTDTGPGMPPEALPRIFERFYQARSPRLDIKGTGLGLAITQRLLRLHGGDIFVESELGKGSVFSGHIPYELAHPPQTMIVTRQDIEQLNSNQLEGLYVLIADDQEMNLLLLKMMLTRWKCRFDMAKDGATAYEMFKTNNYDLVLLDLQMPQLSGLDVIHRIRTDINPRKAAVPVIVLTADITRQDEENFRKAGFNDWLLKPFREKDIYKMIVGHISNESLKV
ncbi:ATP-binding protein [uncultured Chitinophaga sp.]|mgnify:CR=1 FL=1|jgi:Signal transduction histidine kinase|uniref:ATP-binding response regulator n=1 Tax=uncultured Chitinophaga sp. TaxID=339340 RepID=UPI00262B7355|nr:ATP-binding protein [uncultured Chitinophaga sp.]